MQVLWWKFAGPFKVDGMFQQPGIASELSRWHNSSERQDPSGEIRAARSEGQDPSGRLGTSSARDRDALVRGLYTNIFLSS